MIRCAVIDDEPMALELLQDYISKTPFLELAGSYRDALKALKQIRDDPVDLIYLDVNMPDLSGIQFLNALPERPLIIFTTAYSQYAVESYDYEAVDYLLKPVEFDRFLKASNRAYDKFRRRSPDKNQKRSADAQPETVFIKSGIEIHQVRPGEILYIEGAGNYVQFVLNEKNVMSLMTMSEALELLRDHMFVRIHRSYIVAAAHIDVIEPEFVKIHKKKIPIGESYRRNLDMIVNGKR
jgi:two-component system LytT family response regulator